LLIFINVRLIGTFIEGNKIECLKKENPMLYYSLVFFIVAIIAGLLGFGGIAGAATGIAKILFFVFLVLFVLALIFGRRRL